MKGNTSLELTEIKVENTAEKDLKAKGINLTPQALEQQTISLSTLSQNDVEELVVLRSSQAQKIKEELEPLKLKYKIKYGVAIAEFLSISGILIYFGLNEIAKQKDTEHKVLAGFKIIFFPILILLSAHLLYTLYDIKQINKITDLKNGFHGTSVRLKNLSSALAEQESNLEVVYDGSEVNNNIPKPIVVVPELLVGIPTNLDLPPIEAETEESHGHMNTIKAERCNSQEYINISV